MRFQGESITVKGAPETGTAGVYYDTSDHNNANMTSSIPARLLNRLHCWTFREIRSLVSAQQMGANLWHRVGF